MNTLSLLGDEREALLRRIVCDFGEPRLTAEVVPEQAWHKTVWNVVRSRDWDRIRKATYASAGHRCETCGGVGRGYAVACHEQWRIEEWCCTSFLAGFVALCPACHDVKHIGRAIAQGRGEEAGSHLRALNGWSVKKAQQYLTAVTALWQLRNAEERWYVDVWSWLKHAGITPRRSFADIETARSVRSRAPRTAPPSRRRSR